MTINIAAFYSAALGALCLSMVADIASALDPGHVSKTAVMVACWRAFTARDPNPDDRNPDDLAEKLLDADLKSLVPSACGYLDRPFDDAHRELVQSPAAPAIFGVVARTKHIDATLEASLAQGVKQVVILGAGFDSRAYRMGRHYGAVRFFEVDSPATQDDKKQCILRLFGSLPQQVIYVPIDFETQSLERQLSVAGFKEDEPSFFVWEGVTMYLHAEAVDATLRFVAEHCAPGSTLIFDYLMASVADGTYPDPPIGLTMVLERYKSWGEPWIFGIPKGGIREFVDERGFDLVSDIWNRDLLRKYLGSDTATSVLPNTLDLFGLAYIRVRR